MTLVKIFGNLDFDEDFRNISILVKIFENMDCGQNFWENPPFRSKFSRNSDFGQNLLSLDFGKAFRNTSILVKICDK